MKAFILAEKPSVALDITKVLSGNSKYPKSKDYYKVTIGANTLIVGWARGHIMHLPFFHAYDPIYKEWQMDILPFAPKDWKFKVNVSEKSLYTAIKSIVSTLSPGDEIINACDAAREGELIFRRIFDTLPTSKFKMSRMWLRTMTATGIKDAFSKRNPLTQYDDLAEAAKTRNEADWLLGLNMTRMVTLTIPNRPPKSVIPVGRVQTPTLALITDREEEIRKFVSNDYWEIEAIFPSGVGKANLKGIQSSRPALLGNPPPGNTSAVFWDESLAKRYCESAIKNTPYQVTDTNEPVTQHPPLPFDITELQRKCNTTFGWPASLTLTYAQSLYETYKLTTYPRTDSRYLPEDDKEPLYKRLTSMWPSLQALGLPILNQALPSWASVEKAKCFNSSKVTDHFAIIPTGSTDKLLELKNSGNKDEINCYKTFMIILQGTLCALDTPAVYLKTIRKWTSIPNNALVFETSCMIRSSSGWQRWTNKKVDNELEPLTGKHETPSKVATSKHATRPPAHFTEATLLSAMENAGNKEDLKHITDPALLAEMLDVMKERGLGTGATRAATIDGLKSDAYIEVKSKAIHPTEKGINLINFLRKDDLMPLITHAQQTADWEYQLRLIEQKHPKAIKRTEFLTHILDELVRVKSRLPASSHTSKSATTSHPTSVICPVSGKPLVEYPLFFKSEALPKIALWKTIARRNMTAEFYSSILSELVAKKPVLVHEFLSKTDKPFSANLKIKGDKLVLVF